MPTEADKIFFPQNGKGLHWTQRSTEMKRKIEEAYQWIARHEKILEGYYDSDKEYCIGKISDHLSIEKKLIEGMSRGKTEFIFIDIGARDFQWGASASRFINENPLFKDKNITVKIFSLRGEKNAEEAVNQEGLCAHYRYGNFKIENLHEEFSRLGHDLTNKVDIIVSSWAMRHLVDPVGTFIQAWELLEPNQGLIFFDGFWFEIPEKNISDIEDHLLILFSSFKAPFFMCLDDSGGRLHSFVMQKTSNDFYIPLQYKEVKELPIGRIGYNIESYRMTVFDPLSEWLCVDFNEHFQEKVFYGERASFYPKTQTVDFIDRIKGDHRVIADAKYKKALELFGYLPGSRDQKNLKDVKNILRDLLILSPEKALKLIDRFMLIDRKKALAVFNFHDKDEETFLNLAACVVFPHGGELPLLQYYYARTTFARKVPRSDDLIKKLIAVSSSEVIHLFYGSPDETLLDKAQRRFDKTVVQQLLDLEKTTAPVDTDLAVCSEKIQALHLSERPALQFRRRTQSMTDSKSFDRNQGVQDDQRTRFQLSF